MIAIDPGANGGIAIQNSFKWVSAHRMPATDRDLLNILETWKGGEAYLEDIVLFTGSPMPSSRGIKYGASWGAIKGMLLAFRYRVVLVRPQKWQAALSLGNSRGMTKTQWKNKLKQRAEELFPSINVTLATADALLILEAARQQKLG
jgi:hypothetical protein